MNNKLYYLEGVRGIAVVMVVLCHLRNTFALGIENKLFIYIIQSTNSPILSTISFSFFSILFDGNLAVYIFWFMSGYVISIKLFTSNSNYLISAFSKRYFRLLLPVTGSVLFAFILLKFGLMFNHELAHLLGKGYSDGWLAHFYNFAPDLKLALKSAFWDTFFNYNENLSYNVSLWTMNPELYGSIFSFFLFGIWGTNPNRYLFYLPIMLGAFILNQYWIVSFLLGFILCDIDFTNNKIKVIMDVSINKILEKRYISIIIFVLLIFIGGKSNFGGYANLFVSSALVFCVMKSKYLQKIFEAKPLVWLGKISFSIYLLHLPIICSLTCYLYLKLPIQRELSTVIVSIITIIVVLIVSLIYTKYVDKFSIELSNKIGEKVLPESNRN